MWACELGFSLAGLLVGVPELAADGALAYCTGTTPDTGWAAGPAATPPAYCAG